MPRHYEGPRTPRKRKLWLGTVGLQDLSGGGTREFVDLLASGVVDLGISQVVGMTCMRIFGNIRLTHNANASTAAYDTIRMGIGWVSDTSETLHEPLAPGIREDLWIWQGVVGGNEAAAGITNETASGSDAGDALTAYVQVDTSQQRKQPTANHTLALVADPTYDAFEADTMSLEVILQVMLALP